MSLINDMLRDLQGRRISQTRTRSGLPGGIRPVSRNSGSRSGALLLGLLLIAGLAGAGAWQFWPSDQSETIAHDPAALSMPAASPPIREPITSERPHAEPDELPSTNTVAAVPVADQGIAVSADSPLVHVAAEPTSTSGSLPVRGRDVAPGSPAAPVQGGKVASGSAVGQDSAGEEAGGEVPHKADLEIRPTQDGGSGIAEAVPGEHAAAGSQESGQRPVAEDGPKPEEPPYAKLEEVIIAEGWHRPGLWDENPPPSFADPLPRKGHFSLTHAGKGTIRDNYQRGLTALERGNFREAEDLLRHALRDDPGHEPSLDAMLTILLRQERTVDAVGLLSRAVNQGLLSPRLTMILARLHAGLAAHEQALDVLESIPEAERPAEFHALRGFVFQQLGQHEQAARAFGDAVRGGLHTGTNWSGLGIALEGLGRKSEAREAFRRGLELGIANERLAQYVSARYAALR
ncbi:tetratricopeptide repeat protein [Desulfonatronum parangueonense]